MVRVADVLWLVWQTLHFRMADGLWSGWLMFMVRMANSSWPEWLTFHGQDVKLLMVRMANSSQTRWHASLQDGSNSSPPTVPTRSPSQLSPDPCVLCAAATAFFCLKKKTPKNR